MKTLATFSRAVRTLPKILLCASRTQNVFLEVCNETKRKYLATMTVNQYYRVQKFVCEMHNRVNGPQRNLVKTLNQLERHKYCRRQPKEWPTKGWCERAVSVSRHGTSIVYLQRWMDSITVRTNAVAARAPSKYSAFYGLYYCDLNFRLSVRALQPTDY